ncbi:Rv3235 family protein [Mycobacterium sp. CPCC 205372]|uniref:Rv3235 family protein n=1 Tax=Mycobacterium hippophais TaxID=3016340 RepID=A0ABT4PS09_9MYCO|nr:Rv3235 family protein [Mycobacterium hippophais]MCZ8379349.1 Rv3235 family protein [Mycobacterium hippophais]
MPSHTTRSPAARGSFTSPVIDYEPAPAPVTGPCPPPSPAALHRRTPRPLRPAPAAAPVAPQPAALFADAALRRVLEVIDRRRPAAQLRALLAPPLLATVVTHARLRHAAPARLRRVRLRAAGSGSTAAEVFATYTRGERVRAIAGRVELVGPDRWQLVALQIG